MTKEMVVTLLEHLERLGVGMNSGHPVSTQESTGSDALLMSVISAPIHLFLR